MRVEPFELVSQTNARRPGSGKGSGRRMTDSTTLKIAVFAPMPSASTPMTTTVNHRFLAIIRKAYRTSDSILRTVMEESCRQQWSKDHAKAPSYQGQLRHDDG